MEGFLSLRNSTVKILVERTMSIFAVPSFMIGISKQQGNFWTTRKPCSGGNLKEIMSYIIYLITHLWYLLLHNGLLYLFIYIKHVVLPVNSLV